MLHYYSKKYKIKGYYKLNELKIILKKPNKKYAIDIYKLVHKSKVLDLNSEYLYLLQSTHFVDTCSIAVIDDTVVGFVSGYLLPEKANTLFIWQVAVDESIRGQGLAKKLIMNILERSDNRDLNYIHTTVSPTNKSSVRVFEKLTKELSTNMISKNFFEKKDFINQHEEEVLYEIGPFSVQEKGKK